MALTAVYDSRSGTAPPAREDAAPSEHEPTAPMSTAHLYRRPDDAPIEGTVAPDDRTTDATKLAFPLPLAISLLVASLAGVGGIWRIESKVSVITTTIEYERELDRQREKYLDQRFTALEAKIESAGLRNAAMSLSNELQKGRQ